MPRCSASLGAAANEVVDILGHAHGERSLLSLRSWKGNVPAVDEEVGGGLRCLSSFAAWA